MATYLSYEPPFDWQFMLDYVGRRRSEGVETIEKGQFTRTIEINGDTGCITVWNDADRSRLKLSVTGAVVKHESEVKERVRHLFDLDLNVAEVNKALQADPWMDSMRRASPGIRVPGGWSRFEVLVRTIVGQQVSVTGATTIMGRIIERAGRTIADPESGAPALLFPSPDDIASADLTKIGMPGTRVAALQTVASYVARGRIPLESDAVHPDEMKQMLLAVPGIGPWTVEYVRMRALGDADAWPGTDLILRRMVERHPMAEKKSPQEISDCWRPYRAYAAMHLWHAAGSLSR